jgi:4-amino-4-deoxy-L-arabinose transferase-like glycosyltransferase
MEQSGNWLTPTLPSGESSSAYLGKPPLYFWVTALTYKIFGTDEWTSRLPSFLATVLLMLLIFFFGNHYLKREAAAAAGLIFLSSGLVFLLAGACVTDVILTLMLTASIMLAYRYISDPHAAKKFILLSAMFAALAFLTKGPIALVFVVLPFVLWSLLRGEWIWLKRIPFASTGIIFLLFTVPWFAMNEAANPGFLKYFFWNENVARYLYKDYGDKYGSGHVYWRGAAWLMLAGGFLPWTLAFLPLVYKKYRAQVSAIISGDRDALFLMAWALSCPIFLTFIRQLHPMYLLPAIPPLALLLGLLFSKGFLAFVFTEEFRGRVVSGSLVLAGVAIAAAVALFGISLLHAWPAVAVLGLAILLSFKIRKALSISEQSCALSLGFFAFILTFALSFRPLINDRFSAETMLETIADSPGCTLVGLGTANSFSHYWTSRNWKEELAREVPIQFVPEDSRIDQNICYYLTRLSSVEKAPEDVRAHFTLIKHSGSWLLFKRAS